MSSLGRSMKVIVFVRMQKCRSLRFLTLAKPSAKCGSILATTGSKILRQREKPNEPDFFSNQIKPNLASLANLHEISSSSQKVQKRYGPIHKKIDSHLVDGHNLGQDNDSTPQHIFYSVLPFPIKRGKCRTEKYRKGATQRNLIGCKRAYSGIVSLLLLLLHLSSTFSFLPSRRATGLVVLRCRRGKAVTGFHI